MYPFWKMTPGGNPTILLRAADVPPPLRASVAHAVMDMQHLCAEQVGYIRLSGTPRLDMMGGEFCLNATRSFALLLAYEGLLRPEGGALAGRVEVSGVPGEVPVRVAFRNGDLPFAEACLHFGKLPGPEPFGALRLVRVPGIAHIIQEGTPPPGEDLAAFCDAQRRCCGVAQEEAVGHLWLSLPGPHNGAQGVSPTQAQEAELAPVVWVRDTATLCRESACGSGTLACALALHARSGALRFSLRQPSGQTLSVRLEENKQGWDVWVGGPARMTARGETDLSGLMQTPQRAGA